MKLLLTVGEVCERTGWGRTLVYKLLASGDLRSIKVGRTRRIPSSALDEFIDKQAMDGYDRPYSVAQRDQ
jgi:excisionase family DNA binding protein